MENTLQNDNNTQSDQNQTDAPVQPVVTDNASDRTKEQFEKLTQNNSTLNQENELLRKQLEQFKTPPAAPAPEVVAPEKITTQNIPNNIDLNSFVEIDPKTGERYVNETKLTQAIADLQSKTSKAEETIQSYIKTNEGRRIEQQKQEAFAAYPDLQPGSEKFDKTFYKTVRAVLTDSLMNPNEYGKVLSLKEAADYVKKDIVKNPSASLVGEEKEEQKNSNDAKTQAGTLVPSQPQNAPQATVSEDLERLRNATRRGNVEALAQRILATDHVKS